MLPAYEPGMPLSSTKTPRVSPPRLLSNSLFSISVSGPRARTAVAKRAVSPLKVLSEIVAPSTSMVTIVLPCSETLSSELMPPTVPLKTLLVKVTLAET